MQQLQLLPGIACPTFSMSATYAGLPLREPLPDDIAENHPAGFNLFEWMRARVSLACSELIAAAGPVGTVRLRNNFDPKRYVIVSPSLVSPDGWRATRFDELGPIGHTEFKTRESAILCFSGKYTEAGPSWANEFSHHVEKVIVPQKAREEA